MWKLISLFCLLNVAQAANIQDIYGEWWNVAFYPVSAYDPMCIRFGFAGTEEVKCTFSDGRNGTLVLGTMKSEKGEVLSRNWMAMTMVNSAAEVIPALNITAKCDDQNMGVAVVRIVIEDYFILYSPISASLAHTRTEVEENSAVLFGRNIVPAKELADVMQSIEELKNRRGAQMCVTENYGGFNNSENEISD